MNRDGLASHHVVIVGAGISGLRCAKELLSLVPNIRITIVEASDQPGGRIRGHKCHGIEIDIGAEFIHGPGTVLTDLVQDLYGESTCRDRTDGNNHHPTFDRNHFSSELYEPIFTVSHADGGPDMEPTTNGKYGMYYIEGSLRPFDDPYAVELRNALDEMFFTETNVESTVCSTPLHDDAISIGDALDRANLSSGARTLAISSYGNTAASADLYSLSLPIMKHFESFWFKCTTPGDFRFSSQSGITMKSVLDGFVLQLLEQRQRCKFLYNWRVRSIRQREGTSVKLVSSNDDELFADAVVVTIPPPMLQDLDMELSTKKRQALSYVGFPRVVKVILIFSSQESPWPKMLNGLVCADGLPIPEIWFTEKFVASESDRSLVETKEVLYLAVGYLTSQIADEFIMRVNGEISPIADDCCGDGINGKFSLTSMVSRHSSAARIFIHQLAHVLNISEISLKESCIDCILYDWKVDEPYVRGGYMYGKKGMAVQHLYDLATPQKSVFFAGEATNTNACCTVQAAMETGIRAAKEVSQHLQISQ